MDIVYGDYGDYYKHLYNSEVDSWWPHWHQVYIRSVLIFLTTMKSELMNVG